MPSYSHLNRNRMKKQTHTVNFTGLSAKKLGDIILNGKVHKGKVIVPKYTHFTENEITGSYHNDKTTDWLAVAVIAVITLAVIFSIGELTGLTSLIFGTV